jgi:hypothetical protein
MHKSKPFYLMDHISQRIITMLDSINKWIQQKNSIR